jgi:hypothetical protein
MAYTIEEASVLPCGFLCYLGSSQNLPQILR